MHSCNAEVILAMEIAFIRGLLWKHHSSEKYFAFLQLYYGSLERAEITGEEQDI